MIIFMFSFSTESCTLTLIEHTKVVAMVLETVRDTEKFEAGLQKARCD